MMLQGNPAVFTRTAVLKSHFYKLESTPLAFNVKNSGNQLEEVSVFQLF